MSPSRKLQFLGFYLFRLNEFSTILIFKQNFKSSETHSEAFGMATLKRIASIFCWNSVRTSGNFIVPERSGDSARSRFARRLDIVSFGQPARPDGRNYPHGRKRAHFRPLGAATEQRAARNVFGVRTRWPPGVALDSVGRVQGRRPRLWCQIPHRLPDCEC